MAVDLTEVLSFKTFVEARRVKAVPPLGPLAGQYGVNVKPLCADLNALTSKYAKGLPIPVYVIKSSIYAKGYKAFVKPPTMAFLLSLALFSEARRDALDFSEGLNHKVLYDVTRVHSALFGMEITDSAKTLFSYLGSAQVVESLPDDD